MIIDHAIENEGTPVFRCWSNVDNLATNHFHLVHLREQRLGNVRHITRDDILALCRLHLNRHAAQRVAGDLYNADAVAKVKVSIDHADILDLGNVARCAWVIVSANLLRR